MELSVVIPMLNEAENAATLMHEVRGALEGRLDYEIIVVDDGSSDSTFEILTGLRRSVPRLYPARHVQNYGQSAAIATGVRLARAPWVATLDGDGQNDPADIPNLYASVRQGARGVPLLVAGIRRKRHDGWLRRISSRVANGVRQSVLRDGCPDTGCGLKLFERETFSRLPQFDHMHRFLPALFIRAGGQVVNVPVNHRPRMRGQSKYGVRNRLWAGLVDLAGVGWLQRRRLEPKLDAAPGRARSDPGGPEAAGAEEDPILSQSSGAP
ncbi:MAG: glycosyltransferase family 2 protein [Gammaproteobacteria bacterium]|nr:glycosyltransferase family 2 protein [Gammaproteobacteria bacterium]NIR97168.1 glycosyltransferase family 2 protein [Gammaproteobacteria bacterium]NIT62870.1 glycosyltransferase family 2 protein [Gammaproteobacteria bacterium]NIV19835.1 glycosyltransferase [Gammaproteobacteria bacterium]NIY31450.1 glycosyltransferase [Gammaproteobacteria bacterium]